MIVETWNNIIYIIWAFTSEAMRAVTIHRSKRGNEGGSSWLNPASWPQQNKTFPTAGRPTHQLQNTSSECYSVQMIGFTAFIDGFWDVWCHNSEHMTRHVARGGMAPAASRMVWWLREFKSGSNTALANRKSNSGRFNCKDDQVSRELTLRLSKNKNNPFMSSYSMFRGGEQLTWGAGSKSEARKGAGSSCCPASTYN